MTDKKLDEAEAQTETPSPSTVAEQTFENEGGAPPSAPTSDRPAPPQRWMARVVERVRARMTAGTR